MVNMTKSMTPYPTALLLPLTPPFPRVLVFRRPLRRSVAPRPLFPLLFPSPYRFFPLSSFLPSSSFLFFFFLTFFGIVCVQTLDKRGHEKKKADRWRDASRRSGRQMEGEQEDGRWRKEQLLLFLAAGPSYFILLYN